MEYKLSEIADVQTGPFGSQLHNKDYVTVGTPIVTVEHLGNRRFSVQNLPLVSDNDKKRLAKYSLREGDIVFSRVGSVDRCSYVTSFEEGWLFSGRCLRVRCKNNIHPLFLYYYFCNEPVKQYIKSIAVGATMPSINTKLMADIPISLPNITEQKYIADILSSLDDKIELNRHINENLEQQAQALFKSWFVDFEPFKDGKFVNSELGMIPEGWKVGTLSDIIKNTISGDWGKDHPQGNHVRKVFCIRGADIPDIKIGNKGSMPTRFILEKNYQSKVLIDGDVVIEISGGSPTQSTGRVCRISNRLLEKYNNSIICTNFCKAIKPSTGYSSFLYYIWEMLYNQGVMFSYENGTTGIKNLDINGFIQKEQIVIPPISIAADFEKMIKVFYDRIQSNGMESERLAQLRDTLLPKLMSGELKLSEIETKLDE